MLSGSIKFPVNQSNYTNQKKMNKRTLLWALVFAGLSYETYAQDPIAQRYAEQITVKTARKHLKTLASDKYEGRETGKKAGETVSSKPALQNGIGKDLPGTGTNRGRQ